jgi:NADPH2:quinone reductase
MTKAMVIHETGGPEVMQWEDVEVAEPGAGEVRLRQTVVGFNMIDIYRRKGLYPCQVPFITGSEAAGVVESIGEGVSKINPGDRVVYAIADIGAYTEGRLIRADKLVKIPDEISDEVAAAAFLKGLTAWYLVHKTWALKAGDRTLIYAAAGGVGTILCQWASHLGADIIGVVGSDEKAELAKQCGCQKVINYSKDDIVPAVMEHTRGKGVDVVYDSIGADTFQASLDCLRPRGLMVTYGNATGAVPPVNVLELMQRGSLFLTRPTLAHYANNQDDLLSGAKKLFAAIRSGIINIEINQKFDLQDAVKAHRLVESKKTTGATILRC